MAADREGDARRAHPSSERTHVHLATGLALRDGHILLVASRYANHREPLWNLPGGRQRHGELLTETVVREVAEETNLRAGVKRLAYVSESYDGNVHFTNATFEIEVAGDLALPHDDHVVDAAWVPLETCASRIAVAVVREPLLAFLRSALDSGYAGFHEAGVTIAFPDEA